jgi:hypothetical protein
MLNPVHYIDESKAKQLWIRPEISPMIASATSGGGKAFGTVDEQTKGEGPTYGPS